MEPMPDPSRPDSAPGPVAAAPTPVDAPRPETPASRLSLTDFVDVRTLQELQDAFSALTRYATSIYDADGRQLTSPTDASAREQADRVLEWLMVDEMSGSPSQPQSVLAAPIIVEGTKLGSISLNAALDGGYAGAGEDRLRADLERLNLPAAELDRLLQAARETYGANRAAAVQFLYLLANSIARLCYQEHQLRKRLDELSTLYMLSTILSQQRDAQQIMQAAAREAAATFGAKAVGIRLLDEDRRELHTDCVYNLSPAYLQKGPIVAGRSDVFIQALRDGISYVSDMRSDSRVIYPDDAEREGLVSQLCAGMVFKGEPIGVLQLFTGELRTFSKYERDLLKAMAQLLATAIHNARLEDKRREALRVERQLKLAADVQQRMLPRQLPRIPGLDIDARYVPSMELGGDFYDLIEFSGNLGLAIADVSGKGVAASLLMAAVRSSLRAYAQDVYDIDEIMRRVNVSLCRDTRTNEFATLFYGVLDTRTRRLTYCNAGHEPPLLLRQGRFIRLEAGGMVVGVDPAQKYEKGICDLQPGDLLLLYTDGLMDAMNFDRHRFGRDRIMKALKDTASQSAHEVVNHVLWEMRRFAGLAPRTDDTTLVAVRCA